MKFLRTFFIVCILGSLYSSCVKKENYPDVPVITYNSFIPFCSGEKTDSAYLRVNFTDGNGAIGYPQQDESAPNDFIIVPMAYNTSTGKFDTLFYTSSATGADTLISYAYRIPDITPTGTDKELNGIIQINLEYLLYTINTLTLPNFNTNEFQFEVWMYDRAGNKSNVLITPTVYTCQ